VSKYNPNTFLIDSLKTKNEKLNQALAALEAEKRKYISQIEQTSKQSGGVYNKISEDKVSAVISRI
jgi:hypothetical protein